MKYQFLIETYETEIVKVVSVWSMFTDDDLPVRPSSSDLRGRSVHEQMVHQCVSENLWFRNILGIEVAAPPLPLAETRLEFVTRYAECAKQRLQALREKPEEWWEEIVSFFDVRRSRAWVMTRRIAHTAQHRGQLQVMLRMLGRQIHSTYGPTADTGGLVQNLAPTIYAYPTLEALLEGEGRGGSKRSLPALSQKPVTEPFLKELTRLSRFPSCEAPMASPSAVWRSTDDATPRPAGTEPPRRRRYIQIGTRSNRRQCPCPALIAVRK
jgi:uncharacterized damage-inducible protein DinB